jgi:hypothetical protein
MTVFFLERRKRYHDPLDSLGITSTFTIGMAMEPQTGEIKACRWYQLQIFSIRSRRSRCKTSDLP